MPASLETSAMATGLEKSVFIPIPKKGNAKECLNYHTIALIWHASNIMLKFSKPGSSNSWTVNFQMFKLDLEKAEGPEIKLPTALDHWKSKIVRENIYFCFIDYDKAFACVDHNKLWKILQEMGITGHLTCLLSNLYEGQEATVRTGHGKTD